MHDREGGVPGKPRHHRPGFRRCVGLGASEDFVTWSRPGIIVTPDPRHGLAEFYGFTPTVRGNLYLGFLRVLRDDLPATPGGAVEGVGWTELTSSRDGKTWTRHQERFLDRDPRKRGWDHAMAWFSDIVPVGGREHVCYGGYRGGHKVRDRKGDRTTLMAVLRKDGFVSRDAGGEEGFLKTPAAVPVGAGMTVNAVVRGEPGVRLVGAAGAADPPFPRAGR